MSLAPPPACIVPPAHARWRLRATRPRLDEAGDSTPRAPGTAISRVLLAYLAAFTLVLCLQPLHWLTTSFAIDDGFYYPQVARNLVESSRVTYDHRTLTNGFHPLWGAILVPAAAASHGDRFVLLRAAWVLSGLFAIGGLVALAGIGRELRWGPAGTACALALLFFPRIDLWLSLMESGPTMALLLFGLWAMLRNRLLTTATAPGSIAFGALMALWFLVRLDLAFLVVAFYAGSLVLRQRGGHSPKPLLLAGATSAAIVLPYLAANAHWFGSLVPVSGRRKQVWIRSAWDLLRAALEPLHAAGRKTGLPVPILTALVLAIVAVAVVALWRSRRRTEATTPRFATGGVLVLFGIGVVARWICLRIYIADEALGVPWYWVPEYVLFCLVAGWLAARAAAWIARRAPARAVRGFGVAALLAVAALGTRFVFVDAGRYRDDTQAAIANAAWAGTHLATGSLCAMYDPGVFSYFSGLDTVALNGLIADETTMVQARRKQFAAIMQRLGVRYWVVWLRPEELDAVPAAALVRRSDAPARHEPIRGRWLCIVDRSIYAPDVR